MFVPQSPGLSCFFLTQRRRASVTLRGAWHLLATELRVLAGHLPRPVPWPVVFIILDPNDSITRSAWVPHLLQITTTNMCIQHTHAQHHGQQSPLSFHNLRNPLGLQLLSRNRCAHNNVLDRCLRMSVVFWAMLQDRCLWAPNF